VADRISPTAPDWSREALAPGEWSPGKSLLRSIRDYQRSRGIRAKCAVLRHRFWSAVSGADIPLTCKIGGGLLIPHPNGIVIHPDAEIGPNCLLFQQVTIGSDGSGVPRLGGHVDVGAGAKVLGPVRIGDHARIGANAVVLDDIPAGATAVGIPAYVPRPEKARPVRRWHVSARPAAMPSSLAGAAADWPGSS
jgi:serine O-acetyltransferase